MNTQIHPLPAFSAGTQRQLRSLHFGSPGKGPKAYLQASLHADEVPPMLVAQHLAQLLKVEEAEGHLLGEVVLVPMANPIGLSQDLQGSAQGRFDLSTGINFNRHFRRLSQALMPIVEPLLGPDAQANARTIHAQAQALLTQWQPQTETEALKRQLQLLACGAQLVLDLHCDHRALMHVYAGTPLREPAQALADRLGARALLLCEESGDDPFDETVARIWWDLAAHFGQRFPIPLDCLAATVELRGEADVADDLAFTDAQALLDVLRQHGVLKGTPAQVPGTPCPATPLEGVEPLVAPHSGVLILKKALGEVVRAGEVVAEVLCPETGQRSAVTAQVSGTLFATVARRFVSRGMRLAKIAGSSAYRSGKLLSL